MSRTGRKKKRKYSSRRFKIAIYSLSGLTLVLFFTAAVLIFHTLRFTTLVDERLRGKSRERPTWVHARTFELRKGQRLSQDELIGVLNDLGYRRMDSLGDEPGTFATDGGTVHLRRRGPLASPVAVEFERLWIAKMSPLAGGGVIDRLLLEPVPVATLFGEERSKKQWVSLDEIPAHVARAVLATEDRRFFDHTGFDPIAVVRAMAADIQSGELQQGGSTLTQQLVKNYFLAPERTFRRKLLEAYLAIILESRTSKEAILELYLNDVYLGQRGSFGIRGVPQAAQIFFGKNIKNVTLPEAALLAAIIRSPNASSPYRSMDEARRRRDIVLDQMVRAGYVGTAAAEEAKSTAVKLVSGGVDWGEAPHFVDALRAELTDYNVRAGASRVISTMDRYLQTAAQRAVVDGLEEIGPRLARHGKPLPQAALVAMEPDTGDVLAIIGARSYGASQFNRALDAHRQPGSAFKPFVYLAAFENDPSLRPWSVVVDEPTTIRGWRPQNYDRRFHGSVTFRQALALSLNVATARVGARVGFERITKLWDAFDMPSRIEPYPSVVLGSFEVTPLDLATAYAVLANGGKRVAPRLFTTIENDVGTVLASNPVRSRRVVSSESATRVTDMLTTVLESGTAREVRARGLSAQAAGKTGTTDDSRDAWFVGYTPDVLAVVWVGYDDNTPLGLSGAEAALPIWTTFMKAAVSGREAERFELARK
ncbi:MAG TPA: PBP1A family penicillin-binding protein [Vicinamibacteria bacterium]|nr:PBP1A family penicillin-binding protein [Vicinamibacteria bacterium]